jgi:hypothetical protein
VDLTQTILNFVQQNGLATGIVVFAGWFLVGKLWPWYTRDYLPATAARQDNRDKVMAELRDAILELKAMTGQMITALQQHDATTQKMLGRYRIRRRMYHEAVQPAGKPTVQRRHRDRRTHA